MQASVSAWPVGRLSLPASEANMELQQSWCIAMRATINALTRLCVFAQGLLLVTSPMCWKDKPEFLECTALVY